MDLEPIWQLFIERLSVSNHISNVHWKKITGIPFLYILVSPNLPQRTLEEIIYKCSIIAMKGHRLHHETIFVRQDGLLLVFRHRFYVPQEKMFCCGNLCADCTRLIR